MPKRRDPNMLVVKKIIEDTYGSVWIKNRSDIWCSIDGRRISRVNGDPDIKLLGQGSPKPVPDKIKEAIKWLTKSKSPTDQSIQR